MVTRMLAMLIGIVCCVAWLHEAPGVTVEAKLDHSVTIIKQGMRETAKLSERFFVPARR